jgi:ribonuclease HI
MINGNIEIAIKQHKIVIKQDQSITAVYTDGSGINSRVGAAAVCPQYNKIRSVYIGEQSKATVYAAKLQGILLGLIIILRRQIQHVIIFTDNQAVLRALQNPGR